MKYYKVVAMNIPDKYESALVVGKYALTYRIGKKTKPKIGKIFAFANLKDAEEFTSEIFNGAIFIGNSKKARVQRKYCAEPIDNAIKPFWNNEEVFILPMIHGTVLLDHFTPTEIVL